MHRFYYVYGIVHCDELNRARQGLSILLTASTRTSEAMEFPTLRVLTGAGEKPVPWGVELRLDV